MKALRLMQHVLTDFFNTVGGVMVLFIDIVYWILVGPFIKKPPKKDFIFEQMVFVGVRSIVIASFVAIFTGLVLAMQIAYQLQKLGGVLYVASVVAVSLCRELGPVLTALVVSARAGSAITAQLGSMKVTEQIEALEVMALNPVRFLAVPRFVALVMMLPCLTLFADFVGMFGGYLVGVYKLNIPSALYMQISYKFLVLKDVYTGLLKSVVFGAIIALVGCYHGFKTSGGAEGVGRATTLSVVTSYILIIFADSVLTAIFFFHKV